MSRYFAGVTSMLEINTIPIYQSSISCMMAQESCKTKRVCNYCCQVLLLGRHWTSICILTGPHVNVMWLMWLAIADAIHVLNHYLSDNSKVMYFKNNIWKFVNMLNSMFQLHLYHKKYILDLTIHMLNYMQMINNWNIPLIITNAVFFE